MKNLSLLSSGIIIILYFSKNIINRYLENEKVFITSLEDSLNNITLPQT